jgi:hypothetical protein
MSVLQQKAASYTHLLLYVLMFAVPLSGYFYTCAAGYPVVYLGLFELPSVIAPNPEIKHSLKELHEMLTYGMAALVLMHIAAALKHQFIDKDGLLSHDARQIISYRKYLMKLSKFLINSSLPRSHWPLPFLRWPPWQSSIMLRAMWLSSLNK